MSRKLTIACLALAVTLALPNVALAQDEAPSVWAGAAEATFVWTGGNSEASTLGFRVSLGRDISGGTVGLEAGGIRANSTAFSRTAFGVENAFTLVEESVSNLTAENYFARLRYDRPLNDQLFWYGGIGWDRNTFAGTQNRYTVVTGVGRTWLDQETTHFKTDVGVTYTSEEFVADVEKAKFAGLRFSWDYGRQITDNTVFSSILVVDQNLADTSDLRGNFVNSLSVAMSDRFALKTSLQLLWDNQPSLAAIPLLLTGGESILPGSVLVPLEKVDSLLTVALVMTF